MSEVNVMIETGENVLEGLLERGENPAIAAIICHPHPLYGGNMDNGVVVTVQRVLRSWSWSTLRFNFRGVGRSSGSYADGEGEAEDVRAVASYLFQQGFEALHVGAYSFGAWVALKALGSSFQPASMILVSPPVDFLDFTDLVLPSRPCLITLGDRDDFCSLASIQKWIGKQPVAETSIDVEIFPRCDHFYWGSEAILSAKISEFLKTHLSK